MIKAHSMYLKNSSIDKHRWAMIGRDQIWFTWRSCSVTGFEFFSEIAYYVEREIFEPRFSNALTEGSFDSNVIIQIMEQLAQSNNPQQLRRLQTVMAASINEIVAIYKLTPRFL